MRSLSTADFIKRLNHAGITGQVRASQACTAARLYLQSEFPDPVAAEPLFVRSHILTIRCHNSPLAARIYEQRQELIDYVHQATGVMINDIKFRL